MIGYAYCCMFLTCCATFLKQNILQWNVTHRHCQTIRKICTFCSKVTCGIATSMEHTQVVRVYDFGVYGSRVYGWGLWLPLSSHLEIKLPVVKALVQTLKLQIRVHASS